MSSLNEIRKKIKTVESTSKITNAMKLVATAKLKKEKQMFENQEIYYKNFYDIFSYINSKSENDSSIFFEQRQNVEIDVYVLIFSTMGLCGSFNLNMVKEVQNSIKENDEIFIIGKKGKSVLSSKEVKGKIVFELDVNDKDISYDICYILADSILKKYSTNKTIKSIKLYYTHFVNSLSFVPKLFNLLPLDESVKENRLEKPSGDGIYNLENSEDKPLVETIMIDYIATCIYGSILESKVCENASRRNAMDAATKNANELIKNYKLEFNRKRQFDITQEITEIVSGSNVGE